MTSKLEGLEDADVGSIAWIVCWMLSTPEEDLWQPFESYNEAKAFYDDLWKDEKVYTQSLTAVIESTDYDVHPAFHAEYKPTTLEKPNDT